MSPTFHTFGAVAAGSESPTKFTVSNISCQTSGAVSHAIEGSSEFAIVSTTCGPPLSFNSSCEVSVVFRPQSPGDKTGRLVVADGQRTAFMVLLSGTGATPDAGSSPDGADAASAEAAPPDVAGEGGMVPSPTPSRARTSS